jgi:hypothetical protein
MEHAKARVLPFVSLDVSRGLMEPRSLCEDLRRQTRSETLPSTACGETPQPRGLIDGVPANKH